MLIAVTTSNGTDVDQHFGLAQRFIIYDYAGSDTKVVNEVFVEPYCSSDPTHAQHDVRFQEIIEALAGCKAVVTAMIGPMPKQSLSKAGFVVIEAGGPILPALQMAHDTVCGPSCCSGKEGCPHR